MEVIHLDEDRIFSLNIAGQFISYNEDSWKELSNEIDDEWLEKQIKTIIKRQDISLFVYYKEIVKTHDWKKIGAGDFGEYQIIKYRVTLKVQTVISHGGVK